MIFLLTESGVELLQEDGGGLLLEGMQFMPIDFKAIGDAIAVRFGPTVISAPSGEDNVTVSTTSLPATITNEPAILVFPAEVTFSYGPSIRKAQADYAVRFYIYKVRDTPRNADLLNNWMGALYDTLDGQVQLGLPNYVNYAVVRDVRVGPLTYAGIEYHGIEWTVEAHLGQGVNPTA